MSVRLNLYSNFEKKPSVRSDEMSTVHEGQTQNALKYFKIATSYEGTRLKTYSNFEKKPSVFELN